MRGKHDHDYQTVIPITALHRKNPAQEATRSLQPTSKLRSTSNTRRPRILFLHPKTLVDSWPFPVDTLGEIIKTPHAVYPLLAALIRDLPIDVEMFDGY